MALAPLRALPVALVLLAFLFLAGLLLLFLLLLKVLKVHLVLERGCAAHTRTEYKGEHTNVLNVVRRDDATTFGGKRPRGRPATSLPDFGGPP